MSGWPGYTGAELLWAFRVERRARELIEAGLPRWGAKKFAAYELRRADEAEREERHLADIRENGT